MGGSTRALARLSWPINTPRGWPSLSLHPLFAFKTLHTSLSRFRSPSQTLSHPSSIRLDLVLSCMAANSKGRVLAGSFAKRFVNQIWVVGSRNPSSFFSFAASASRRSVHASTYDKNIDDQVHPNIVPDDVISVQSDKYWGPHPKTGVFGPADQNSATGGDPIAPPVGNGPSVLDQKVWFRPLEDVDKPPHA